MAPENESRSSKRFAERLHTAQERRRGGRDESSVRKTPGNALGMAFRIGVELVSALVVGVGIGWLLDYWLDTRPWFLLLFFLLGAGAGILNVYRAVERMGRNNDGTGNGPRTV